MLKKIGVKSNIVSNANEISNSEKIILPGVGSFDNGVRSLKEKNFQSQQYVLEIYILAERVRHHYQLKPTKF